MNGSESVADIVKAASGASKEIQDRAKEELSDIRAKYNKECDDLKVEFQEKAKKEKLALERRLEGRNHKRLDELVKQVTWMLS